MFPRLRSICRACEPYRPSGAERAWVRAWLGGWGLWSFMGAVIAATGGAGGPFLLLMSQGLIVGGVLATTVHEAGHALTARAMGAGVSALHVGRGPPRLRFHLGETEVVVGRYFFLGGVTHQVWLGEGSRWRRIAVVAAGPLADLMAAAAAFTLCGWVSESSEAVAALLAGLGLAHLFSGLFNLWPRPADDDEVPSDGALILALLRWKPAPADPFDERLAEALALCTLRRFPEAAEAARQAWALRPQDPHAPSLLLHAISHDEGPDAALAYFRAHRAAFEAAEATEGSAYLLVNIADVALRAGPGQDLGMAEAYSTRALAAAPGAAPMLGTEGQLLVERGAVEAGEVLLQKALRASDSAEDRAQFADLLARAALRRGDQREAEAYARVARHQLGLSTGSARA